MVIMPWFQQQRSEEEKNSNKLTPYTNLPNRYKQWWHPEKSLSDIFLSYMFPRFLPLHDAQKYPPLPPGTPTSSQRDQSRRMVDSTNLLRSSAKNGIHNLQWSASSDSSDGGSPTKRQSQNLMGGADYFDSVVAAAAAESTTTSSRRMSEAKASTAAFKTYVAMLRTRFLEVMQPSSQSYYEEWKSLVGCDIVHVEYHVPRSSNLLQGWNLMKTPTEQMSPRTRFIPVHLYFPLSLVAGKIAGIPALQQNGGKGIHASNNSNSHRQQPIELPNYISESEILEVLCKQSSIVPWIVNFHSGGFCLGHAEYSTDALETICKLTHLQLERGSRHCTQILASVEYSLAPEYPFPVAMEEALTVICHLISHTPPLHLLGTSSGANLAVCAALEVSRRFPGRIRSVLLMSPMIDPAADSLSYHLNGACSSIPAQWLRWCWQCYLQLPPSQDVVQDMACGSNRTTWRESKYKDTTAERLIHPVVDLPDDDDEEEEEEAGLYRPDAPHFFITTHRGDPLKMEGIDLVGKLRIAGAKHITHFNHKGSHWFFNTLNTASYRQLLQAWVKPLYGEA